MTRWLTLALICLTLALGSDARSEGAGHAANDPSDVSGGQLSGLSLYQLEGDWTSASGDPVKLSSLRGSPVLLLLFYGTCDYACPLLVHDLQRVEGMLAPAVRARVRFALVTFDPEHDTRERLAAYAREMGLSAPGWLLLHGTDRQVRELAATVGVRYRPTGSGAFSHTMRIVLLDRDGVPADHWDGLSRPVEPIAAAATALAQKPKG